MVYRFNYLQLSSWNLYQNIVMQVIFLLAEPIRLYAGYHGNLKEQVPDITSLLLLSLVPQLLVLVVTTFEFFQSLIGDGTVLELEYSVNLVYIILVAMQLLFGYRSCQHLVQVQNAEYGRYYNDQDVPTNNIIKSVVFYFSWPVLSKLSDLTALAGILKITVIGHYY